MNWDELLAGVQQLAFFSAVYDFLDNAIKDFTTGTLARFTGLVASMALTALTIWIMIQGYRIVTGQSRESMSALMANAGRAAVICACASGFAMFGFELEDYLNDGLRKEITYLVTGDAEQPEQQIDRNLALMTVSIMAIDHVQSANNAEVDARKRQAKIMAGIGAGGPAIVAASMLLLYKIAIAMFIGFGPIFILSLLFEQTKSLFMRWVFYGVGTYFSLAVLVFVTSVAMEMVARVAAAVWTTSGLLSLIDPNMSSDQGFTSQSLQQGGMGLILSTLILATPPMAAMFFQGALGNFSPYAGMGGQFGAAATSPPGVNNAAAASGRMQASKGDI
jgi:type IV secretion system protein VirB6